MRRGRQLASLGRFAEVISRLRALPRQDGERERAAELAGCKIALEQAWASNREVWATNSALHEQHAAAEERYQRDCLGLNNEGDPIGGDPPVGWKARAEKAEAEARRMHAARNQFPGGRIMLGEALREAPVPSPVEKAKRTTHGAEIERLDLAPGKAIRPKNYRLQLVSRQSKTSARPVSRAEGGLRSPALVRSCPRRM